MDNQHRKIRGYRELNEDEIDLINEIKVAGERLEQLVAKVNAHIVSQSGDMVRAEAIADRHLIATPARWAAEGRTDLQKGIMSLTRAVAQPVGF